MASPRAGMSRESLTSPESRDAEESHAAVPWGKAESRAPASNFWILSNGIPVELESGSKNLGESLGIFENLWEALRISWSWWEKWVLNHLEGVGDSFGGGRGFWGNPAGFFGKLPRIVKKLRRIPENVFFLGGGIILKLERNWDRNLQRIVQESWRIPGNPWESHSIRHELAKNP